MMKRVFLSLTILFSLSNCATPQLNTTKSEENILVKTKYNIKGIVQFPDVKFKVKANSDDISKESSVSIIYPSEANTPNKTISSTVSDVNGVFDLKIGVIPPDNQLLILEATKRLGGVGNNIMSLRTFIKWTNNGWKSIATPNIFINSHTTALSIIANYNKDLISPDETIDKVLVNSLNNTINVSDIGIAPNIKVTNNTISQVKDLVDTALFGNKDPFYSIKYSGGTYYIGSDSESGQFITNFISNNGCSNCDLRNKDLKGIDLSNKDLSGSNLSGVDLSEKDLTNTNLTNANLSGCNMSYMDLSTTILKGANMSDTYLINSTLSNRDLTGTNFSYAYLKNSDFSGSIINSTTNFSNADLSNALWVDNTEAVPHICQNNSFGQCN